MALSDMEERKYMMYSLITIAQMLSYAEDDGECEGVVKVVSEGEFYKVDIEFDETLLQPFDLRINNMWFGAYANKGLLIDALDDTINTP